MKRTRSRSPLTDITLRWSGFEFRSVEVYLEMKPFLTAGFKWDGLVRQQGRLKDDPQT